MIIKYKWVDSKTEIGIQDNGCSIKFEENCVTRTLNVRLKDIDDTIPGEREIRSVICINRENVAGIELYFNDQEKWLCSFVLDGFSSDVLIFFEDYEEAFEMFKKIKAWRYGGMEALKK